MNSQRNKSRSTEFIFEIFSLIAIAVIVQGVYATVVRPRADALREHDMKMMETDKNYVPKRSPYVIIKDYEQEVCVILSLWAFAIMGYKAFAVRRARAMLSTDLLSLPEGMKILPEDTRDYARQVEALPAERRDELLPRALLAGLHRFGSTRNIQDVSSAIHGVCQLEFDRMDSELSMVRYVAWAIPAIGFVGTVRGIGESLQQAHKAVEGDVSGVVAGLGVSFNSTLVALALSITVMFLLHQIQLRQERAVLDTEEYLDQSIVRQMLVN
ncbi:MAG: MotA/TolQ/ExbB proton channel family protein [Steroidobacteraceae bacterium]